MMQVVPSTPVDEARKALHLALEGAKAEVDRIVRALSCLDAAPAPSNAEIYRKILEGQEFTQSSQPGGVSHPVPAGQSHEEILRMWSAQRQEHVNTPRPGSPHV